MRGMSLRYSLWESMTLIADRFAQTCFIVLDCTSKKRNRYNMLVDAVKENLQTLQAHNLSEYPLEAYDALKTWDMDRIRYTSSNSPATRFGYFHDEPRIAWHHYSPPDLPSDSALPNLSPLQHPLPSPTQWLYYQPNKP